MCRHHKGCLIECYVAFSLFIVFLVINGRSSCVKERKHTHTNRKSNQFLLLELARLMLFCVHRTMKLNQSKWSRQFKRHLSCSRYRMEFFSSPCVGCFFFTPQNCLFCHFIHLVVGKTKRFQIARASSDRMCALHISPKREEMQTCTFP